MCRRRSLHTCRRARNCIVSPKSGVAAGGITKRAMTQAAASPMGGGGTKTDAAAAMNRTAGWGTAAMGREPTGGVRNGGGWRGLWPTRHRLWGRLGDTGGGLG